MSTRQPLGPGVLDGLTQAPQLVARAVDATPSDDRLHGYAVIGDLAAHYQFSDLLYVAITGDTPDDRASALFRLALCAFAPASVRDAPTHAAVVSRVCAAPVSSALGIGMMIAAEEARDLVDRHLALLAGDAPAGAGETTEPWVATICDAVRAIDPQAQLPRSDMTRDAASIAVLVLAGIRDPDRIVAAIVAARVCGIVAETLATGPQHFAAYPVQVPQFSYVEDDSP